MENIKEEDKNQISFWSQICPSKPVGEEKSKEEEKEEEEGEREEVKKSGMFLPWNHGYLDS